MAKSPGELLRVPHEVEQRIHHVHIPARSRERIWLSLVDQVELEGVVVARLRDPSNGLSDRSQLVVQGGGFDDFSFGLQLVEDFLAHLLFFILTLLFVLSLAASGCNYYCHTHRRNGVKK